MWVICLYCSIWQVLKGYRKRVYYCLRWWEFILKNKSSLRAGRGNCLINYLVILSGLSLFGFLECRAAFMSIAQSGWGLSSPGWEILHSLFTLHLYFVQQAAAWVGLVSGERPILSVGVHPGKRGPGFLPLRFQLAPWGQLPSLGLGQCLTPSYAIRQVLESRETEGECRNVDEMKLAETIFLKRSFWMLWVLSAQGPFLLSNELHTGSLLGVDFILFILSGNKHVEIYNSGKKSTESVFKKRSK